MKKRNRNTVTVAVKTPFGSELTKETFKHPDFREVAPAPLVIGGARAREISGALADVLCWFRGFQAAGKGDDLPPGIETLRQLNIELKRTWEDND